MYVLSLFEHSLKLELAILELEKEDTPTESILVVLPVEKKYLDPYNSDGLNLFLVSAIGFVFMLLGSMYGFVLYWGPIIWASFGLVAGTLIGLAVDYFLKKTTNKKRIRKHIIDVVLLVKCEKESADKIEKILGTHYSLGLARIE